MLKRDDAIAGFKLTALAISVGSAYIWWLLTPIYNKYGIESWLAIGMVVSAIVGGIGSLMIGGWLRTGIALAMGIVISTACVEYRRSDVNAGLVGNMVGSLFAAILDDGYDLLGPCIVSGFAGAFLTHFWSHKKARCQRVKGDS